MGISAPPLFYDLHETAYAILDLFSVSAMLFQIF